MPLPTHPLGADARVGRAAWPLLAIGLVALGMRALMLARVGGLAGVGGYDDGVHYAAADALVHGRLPYRDFLLLQPPGIVVAVAPFAWLGSLTTDPIGFGAARIVFLLLGTLAAVLVGVLLRPFGRLAVLGGGGFAATFWPLAYSDRSVLLEPLGNVLLLTALVLLRSAPPTRRRAVLAGLALGAAVSVKIWFVVPLLVVLAFQHRHRGRIAAGAAVAAGAVLLPFLAAAPGAMIREVVADQAGRDRDIPVFSRIGSMVGLGQAAPLSGGATPPQAAAIIITALVVVGATAVALRRRDARPFVALLAADVVVLLAGPLWYVHYAAWSGIPVALVLGAALSEAVGRSAPALVQRIRAGAAVAAIATLLLASQLIHLSRIGDAVPVAGLQAAAARVPGCIPTDDPTLAILMNTLSRDLAAGCPRWPDVTGWTYDTYFAAGTPREDNEPWQRAITAYLTSGDAFVAARGDTGYSPATSARLRAHPLLFSSGRYRLNAVPR